MDKEHILNEIRRLAEANGGKAPGRLRFENETGISYHGWCGRHWARWSDAVREAGLQPNRMCKAYDDEFLLKTLAQLTRNLNHAPTHADLRLEAQTNPSFPSTKPFRRLGNKSRKASRIVAFCEANSGYEDVADLWREYARSEAPQDAEETDTTTSSCGYVYMLKHGSRREYKIGRTNNILRREGEVGIELPEEVKPLHHIKTDDPAGVEAYWHKRFASRRKKGEWFELTPADVRAFKRWKKIF